MDFERNKPEVILHGSMNTNSRTESNLFYRYIDTIVGFLLTSF